MIDFARRYAPSPPTRRLFLFMGFVWAAIVGPISSVLIISSLGATSQQIGIFSAICAVISMVLQPLWGFLSDMNGSPRRVLCMCLGAATLFYGCVMLSDSLYIVAGLLFLEIAFRCCVIPLLDSHTLSEVNTIPGLQYSFVRMGASFFFGSLSLIYGGIISAGGAKAVIPVSLCIAAAAVLWGLFIAKGQWETKPNNDGVRARRPELKKDAALLLKNKRYIVFLVLVALWALANMPLYTFIIDYVKAVGGNSGQVPVIHALRCVAELPFFIFAGTVGRRMESKKLMLSGMVFSLLHMIGLLLSNTFFWLCVSHFLAGPGFILGLTGRMRYVSEIAPESVRSTSIALMGACEIGLGSIIGNLIVGYVSGTYGTQAVSVVAIIAILSAMAMLILCVNRQPHRQARTH
ncbi:MAG: MFS transporter [Clostridia bacterium]|nr:MFS transporter [Clostridia bacterium]